MKNTIYRVILGVCLSVLAAATVFAGESPGTILFDQGHGQRFLIGESGELHLSKLAEIVSEAGGTALSSTTAFTNEVLGKNSGVIISGPFAQYKPEEIEALLGYMDNGGRVAFMLHIGQPLADILHRLDIDISNSVLHERQYIIGKDTNFQVKDLASSSVMTGLESFSLYGGWALNPGRNVQSLARTSNGAWVDLDGDRKFSEGDASMAFSVVVSGGSGKGGFIVFGDDAIFQNSYLDQNNKKLATNLANWLLGK